MSELDALLEEDKLVQEARAELRTVQQAETRRVLYKPYKFYEPNGKCEEFIHAVGSGDYFVVLFSAANGVGKSAAGANVVANIVFPNSGNKYFTDPLYRDWPFPKRGRIATDPGNISNLVHTLKEWFPRGKYETNKAGKAYESKWWTGDQKNPDWEWEIMSYEQDPKDFEGPTLGFVWFDEPPPESIFKACVARLRKGGIIFISATPLLGSGWMYDHIIAGDTDDPELAAVKAGQRKNLTADVEAACRQHGVRGHLEHSDIEKMIGEYSEDEKQARVHGLFQHLIGLIFKQFSREIHVIERFPISMREYTVYHSLDPHPRTPDAGMWLAVDRKGRKIVVDELYERVQGDTDLAERLKRINDHYRIEGRMIDPSAFNADQHANEANKRPLAERLADHGLVYQEASKDRRGADRRIEEALVYQMANGIFLRQPELFVFSDMKRTIFEFEHYRWQEWTGKAAEQHDKKEKPVDKDDHMIENLGRLLYSEPVFVEMPVERYIPPDNSRGDPYDRPAGAGQSSADPY